MGVFDQPPQEFTNTLLQNATLGTSERFRAARLAETYYESKQYVGLREWTATGALHKKKPREIIPLYKTCVDTMKRFVWGGSRFPRVTVGATREDGDKPGADEIGPLLSNDDARDLTTFVLNMIKTSRLDRCVKEYSQRALITTSAAVIVGTRGGYLTYYVEPGYHCTPTFDPENPRRVAKLEIVYQYQQEVAGAAGAQRKLFWFRRVVDELVDTVYLPIEVRADRMPAPDEWRVDDRNSAVHGLGFCPVAWIRIFPVNPSSVDGQPFIDPALYPLLDRINYVYSQRGRAVEYGLDPQWIRKNVDRSDRANLEKHPGAVWDIVDQDKDKKAEINLVESRGTGADAARNHLVDMSARFLEAVGVVLDNADKVSGALSGVILEYLHAPMIAVASDLRKDLGDDGFGDLINLCLRVVTHEVLAGKNIWVQGAKRAAKAMDAAQLGGVWLDFPVRLHWGRYFQPTGQDIQLSIQAADTAKKGQLVAQASATRFVSDFFGVYDINAEIDDIDSEAQERQQQALDLAKQAAPPAPSGTPPAKNATAPKAKPAKRASTQPNRPGKA